MISEGEVTLHRPKPPHLPHQPAQLLDILRRAGRIAEFPLRVVFLRQIQQDGAALEDALVAVGNGGDAAVGVDFEEPAATKSAGRQFVFVFLCVGAGLLLLLLVRGNVNRNRLVWQAELFQEDGDLDAVGRGHAVEGDVGCRRHGGGYERSD